MLRLVGWMTLLALSGGCSSPEAATPLAPVMCTSPGEVVRLKYAGASEVVAMIEELFQAMRLARANAVPGLSCALPKPGMEDSMHRALREMPDFPRLAADPRTNSVTVSATGKEEVGQITNLIRTLDRPARH